MKVTGFPGTMAGIRIGGTTMDWTEITADEFEALPEPATPRRAPEWDPIMARLEAGTPVRIPVADEADRRKKRLSVGRRAAIRGFAVEIRYGEGVMAVRRGADREKLRAGRLPKAVAEAAHGLVDAARERLTRHEDSEDPQDAPVLEALEASADDGVTVDPALTDGPFGDAPAVAPDLTEPAAQRPGRRKAAAS